MTYVDKRKEWIRSRRKRRHHARRSRLHRQVFRYIMCIALLWGGTSGLMHLRWNINDANTDIIVRGNNVVSSEQVREAIGPVDAKQLFQLDPHKLESKVASLKAVKFAFVRRHAIPRPTITVDVLEEYPWATFSTAPDQPPQAVIAQSGRLIPIKDFPTIEQPPLMIYGQPGLKMTSKSVAQWASWIAFISAQTGEPVQYVDFRKNFEICVQNGDLFLKLGAADNTLTRRLGRLSSILTAIEPLKSRLEYVDLGLDNNIPLKVAKKPIEGRVIGNVDHMQEAHVPGIGDI